MLLLVFGQAQAQTEDTVTLNFINSDIEGVVKAMSEITGRNFVLDPRVKGTINIVSGRPMARALVYEVFLSALRLQGYAVVEDRGIVKVMPEADAKLHPGSQVQTRVFTLRHESAAQLVPILRPLIAPANAIAAYPGNNTLVITDYAANLPRLARIIESIDQPGGSDPVLIPLLHASALDVAVMVNRLFADPAQGADGSPRMNVVADARSNSLVARSDNPARLARLRSLAAMLDSPTSAAGNLHVVYLKNAEAVRVAETLRAIYLGEVPPATAPAPAPAPMAIPVSAAPGGAPAAAALSPLPGPRAVALTPGMIQADAATNAILINAPDAIYNNLRAALDKLDVRRAQVYVEALIAEITADKAGEFGIQWQSLSGGGRNDTQGFGGTNFGNPGQNILGISANPASAGRGLNVGVINGMVSIPGIGQVLNLNLLVRALESDSNANILSTPTLLTLDNEEARIIIGQNVPFITGQYALSGAATTPTPFQTVERRDVGLTLRVRPQISEGGTVRLQIYQEVSSVQDSSNPAGVVTNKRAVESMVLVDDGQIVVIGGLIQDSLRDGVEKVPFLGDLPLLGPLFTYATRARTKTNLMVFLRPTVLRDTKRAESLTAGRYDYIIGEQIKAKPPARPFLPDMDAPQLPPW
jgi:general secretion pathway protein D